MKFRYGPPPENSNFRPQEDSWTPVREPSPLMFQLGGAALGIFLGVGVGLSWGVSVQIEPDAAAWGQLALLISSLALLFVGLPSLIAVHELIHALGYPRFGWGPATVIGVWPSRLLFYAISMETLGRNRTLLVYALPLLMISVLPLVICHLLGVESLLLMAVSTANALASGGDLFGFLLIVFQVPRNAIIRNQGWRTWWMKRPDRPHPGLLGKT